MTLMLGAKPSIRGGVLRKFIVSAALIAGIAVIGFGIVQRIIATRPTAAMSQAENLGATVDVLEVQRFDYQQVLTGYGTVLAMRTATLASQVSGRVHEVDLDLRIGSEVKAGRVLCRIEEATYREEHNRRSTLVDQSEIDLERLKLELANIAERVEVAREDVTLAEQDVARQERLKASNAAPEQALDRSRSSLIGARRNLLELQNQQITRNADIKRTESLVQTRRAEMELARLDLDRCKITAPFTGIIAERFVEPGEIVAAGSSLIRLTDVATVEVPIHMPASEVGAISVGSPAELRLPQGTEGRWSGKIVRISPEVDTLNRTVAVYVQVNNRVLESPLLPGELVRAEVEGRLYSDVIVVPRRAMIDGLAFVKRADIAERRKPAVLRAIGDDLLIESGLEPGELLILTNIEMLYDGAKVATSAELNDILRRRGLDGVGSGQAIGH